jgi:hypothetical protein
MNMATTQKQKPQAQQPKQTTAVAKTDEDNGALVLVQDQVPEHLKDAIAGNRGSENVGQEDLVIPRLEVLQALSPECTEGNEAYVKGARPGDLMNSVTKQIYGREAHVVPVHYTKQYLVWIHRDNGGGFRGSFATQEEAEASGRRKCAPSRRIRRWMCWTRRLTSCCW